MLQHKMKISKKSRQVIILRTKDLDELYSNLTREEFENLVNNARKYRAETIVLRDELKKLKEASA